LNRKGGYSLRRAVGRREAALALVVGLLIAGLAVYSSIAPGSTLPPQSSSTSSPTFSSSTISLGFLTELSAGGEPNGYAARIGAELAVNETNSSGGVDGKNINLIVLDSGTNPSIALQQARVLDQQGVLALTGPTDPHDAIAVRAYAEAHGVPFLASAVQSGALIPPGSNWTLALQPDPVQMGAALAKYVAQVVPSPKIALMTQNAVTQKEMAGGVRWFAGAYNNETIVFDQVFSNAQFPWATPAAAAKFAGANAVVVSWLPTVGFAEENVIAALLSAGFSQSQIFVVYATDQVSDLGTNATGIRGATLFDGAMAQGNVSAFVNRVEPFIKGQTAPFIPYCGVCPTEVGSNYYYSYLGTKLMIDAIRTVLTSGQTLTRADFFSTLKQASTKDVFGNSLRFDTNGAALGRYYLVSVGQPNPDGSTYALDLIKDTGFAPGVVPTYDISRHA
jgi:ABC-type branched-subunit amino acid transport system substrate-binding protein